MEMTDKEYGKYVARLADKSPLGKDVVCAFVIGGLICVIGQLIMNGWTAAGLSKDAAGTATSVSMILLSAILTGLSIYDDIAKVAGAGTIVPITGFANSVVSPAIEFKAEGFVTGMAAKMFTIAGPVIVYGTTASVIYGLILYVFDLV
ncbi:MAG: stage V sporulation protein AC [Clostridia bacterium]|nr:stage V sporulation protein AC [Clostridia bacterium]